MQWRNDVQKSLVILNFDSRVPVEPYRLCWIEFSHISNPTSYFNFYYLIDKKKMLSTIWHHLYNLKNGKNIYGGMLLSKVAAFSLKLY